MKNSFKVGMGFGLSSATITTLGLIMGLESSTGSRLAIIGGILTIAIADSFSDALGVHIAKESEGNFSKKEIWQATLTTFLFKAVFAASFLIPILLLPLHIALGAALAWGAVILFAQSYQLAREAKVKAAPVILEHLSIAAVVVLLTHYLGRLIAASFGG
jgi:VIT1/CCC1 family predicted Fe2+/Mn2+ transporter